MDRPDAFRAGFPPLVSGEAVYYAPNMPPKTFKPDRLIILPTPAVAPGFARSGMLPFPFETLDPMPHVEHCEKACNELDQILTDIFKLLAVRLNAVHKVDFPEMFWKMPVYSWLIKYVHITYDFHARLEAAVVRYGKESVTVLAPEEESDFIRTALNTMGGNEVASLYALIAHEMGLAIKRIPYPKESGAPKSHLIRDYSTWLPRLHKKGWELASAALLKIIEGDDVFIGVKVFDHASKKRFSRKLGVRWTLSQNVYLSGKDLDRNALLISGGRSKYERIAGRLLPLFIPRYLAEEFESYLHAAKSCKKAKLYVPGNSWHRPLEAYAISWGRLQGAPVAGWQHGGAYGQYESMSHEFIERDMADYFITWGWSDRRYPGAECIPLPQPHLTALHNIHKGGGSNILWCGTTNSIYMHRLQIYPFVADHIPTYFKNRHDFAAALNPEVRCKLVYRPLPADFGWMKQDIDAIRQFPDIKVDMSGYFVQRLKKARLYLCDHGSTTFLEALTANVPTIIFWDDAKAKEREDAKEYFDLLRNAGILHHDPIAAANQLNRVWDNVEEWWGQPERQKARVDFMHRFCRVSDQWESEWMDALLRMMPGRDASK